jgi:uncharacterized protein involved in response to NO
VDFTMLPMKHVWRMVREEPYRLFFPMGALAGIWGVMLWPALYAGMIRFYPGEAHTRIMVEGFIGAFVAGFLGTAFPRLTGNRTWSAGELLVVAGLWGMSVMSHACNHVAAGDAAFAAMLLALLAGMARRMIFGHRDTPPPGFILVVAGVLGAAFAAVFLGLNPSPSPMQWQWARLWLFQGFLVLPLMGIGPYVVPRFFGMPSSHSFDDSPVPPTGWWRRCVMAVIAGLVIIAGFALEVHGKALAGQWLRAIVIVAWFASETPILRRAEISTTPGNAVRWSIISLAAGLICAAMWPLQRVGSLHLYFVSGIGLITLTVGTRVILGHAGRHDLLGGKILWLRWVVGLAILAATTRMSADFLPAIRASHHIYAAWTWAILSLIWLVALGRYLLRDENSPKPPSRCPRKAVGENPS